MFATQRGGARIHELVVLDQILAFHVHALDGDLPADSAGKLRVVFE
jgi:hypothetical protein